MNPSEKIVLSSTTLGLFEECPFCFWLEKRQKIKRPRGIFPSLPSGMDRKIKTFYDGLRVAGMKPAELCIPRLEGFDLYHDLTLLKAWRQWNSKGALKVETPRWTLVGGFDDVLYSPSKGLYAPLDYKTTGNEDRAGEDVEKFYQRQMDLYTLMLKHNEYEPAGFAVLQSFAPVEQLPDNTFTFNVQTFILETDHYRAMALCDRAAAVLASDVAPPPGMDCEWCNFVSSRAAMRSKVSA